MRFDQLFLHWTGLAVVNPNTTINVLPKPRKVHFQTSNNDLVLSPSPTLHGPDSPIIKDAFGRTLDRLNLNTNHIENIQSSSIESSGSMGLDNVTLMDSVTVVVGDLKAPLQYGVNEAYKLGINDEGIRIDAATTWGVLHAFTTLEQLLNENKLLSNAIKIVDKPLYPYRGVHIDTARNFYTVESLKRQIDAMSMSKMNVFHWHLTDNQAWPLTVESYPQMTKDAYSENEVYTFDDIKSVVQYAYKRGVRVMPELDMPGHSSAGWQQIDPNLLVCLDVNWEQAAVQPTTGHLNILNPKLYDVLGKIYNDTSALFKDNWFHVGFDELNIGCYKKSNSTMDWLKKNGKNWSDLAQHWVDKTQKIFHNRPNRRLMMWQDSVTSENIPAHSIPKDTVLQTWSGGMESVKNLTSMGYDVVVSTADYLYLDCGFGNWLGNDTQVFESKNEETEKCSYNYGAAAGSWCGPYKSWQRIYALDLTHGLTTKESKHVLGASTALWSEQTDSNTVDGMIWPRSAALAELLWSGNRDGDGNHRHEDLLPRILIFREWLVKNGLRAAALMPKWCVKYPEKCMLSNSE